MLDNYGPDPPFCIHTITHGQLWHVYSLPRYKGTNVPKTDSTTLNVILDLVWVLHLSPRQGLPSYKDSVSWADVHAGLPSDSCPNTLCKARPGLSWYMIQHRPCPYTAQGIHHIIFSSFHRIFLENLFSPVFTRIFSRKKILEKMPVNFSSLFLTSSLEFSRLFLGTFLSTVPKNSDFRRLKA